METVVYGIEAGGHSTRTLVDRRAEPALRQHRQRRQRRRPAGREHAADHARGDPALRARRRYPRAATRPAAGEVFASGLRNEVGLSIDSKGRMWGVENGRDNLMVGGDIHFDNPAEEVNLFDTTRPGRNYGYPFCWSEGIWMDTAMAKGPRDAAPGSRSAGRASPRRSARTRTSSSRPRSRSARTWRRSTSSNTRGERLPGGDGRATCSSPRTARGTARSAQVGRTIIRLKMGGGGPTEAENFLGESDGAGGLRQGNWGVRPVSIRVDAAGLLTSRTTRPAPSTRSATSRNARRTARMICAPTRKDSFRGSVVRTKLQSDRPARFFRRVAPRQTTYLRRPSKRSSKRGRVTMFETTATESFRAIKQPSRRRARWRLFGLGLLVLAGGCWGDDIPAQPPSTTTSYVGQTREYWIVADDVLWDYAPSVPST